MTFKLDENLGDGRRRGAAGHGAPTTVDQQTASATDSVRSLPGTESWSGAEPAGDVGEEVGVDVAVEAHLACGRDW